jgi:hypothetical protein
MPVVVAGFSRPGFGLRKDRRVPTRLGDYTRALFRLSVKYLGAAEGAQDMEGVPRGKKLSTACKIILHEPQV